VANAQAVIVKTYSGSQEAATSQFQSDAMEMAKRGYFPSSQSYAPGAYGCGSFILAIVLCFLIIGVLILLYMFIVKPDGILTVTYEFREAPPVAEVVAEKICPQCAERVKAAAKICRFCNHQF
jgi:hypothetical protein